MNKSEHDFGLNALERMAEAPRFNEWMYEVISPYLQGKILEIGSGIGNLSTYFIENKKCIWLSDYDKHYINLLRERFGTLLSTDVLQIDLSDPLFKEENQNLENSFDAVFLLNVLEHIDNDYRAVEYCKFLLRPGGDLLILVPAYPFLFSKMDKLLGHFRRYTVASLNNVIRENDLEIEKTFHFNTLGIAGWLWNKLFNTGEISQKKWLSITHLFLLPNYWTNFLSKESDYLL
jgi:SAM-dependent methyltransferase